MIQANPTKLIFESEFKFQFLTSIPPASSSSIIPSRTQQTVPRARKEATRTARNVGSTQMESRELFSVEGAKF
jgi:hypothetical protein